MTPFSSSHREINFATEAKPRNLWIVLLSLAVGFTLMADDVSCQQVDSVVPSHVEFDTLFSIGGPDGPVDELIFRPQRGRGTPLMDLGPDGMIWILNPGDQVLMVFDESGQKLKTWGGSGSGPGEFRAAFALTAVEGGAWTWDWTNQQLCRWSLTEGLVSTQRTQIPQPLMNQAVLDENGTLWFMNEVLEEPALEIVPVHLYCSDQEGVPVDIATFGVPGVVYPRQAGVYSFLPEIAPATGGGVIIAPTHRFDLHHYQAETGSPADVWTLPPIETPYTSRQLQPGGRGSIGIPPDLDKRIEPPLLPHQPDIESLHRVNKDEIWVGTSVRGEDRVIRYDRLDRLGNRIGAVWLQGRSSALRYDGTNLYMLAYGLDGYQVYKIRMHIR